MDPYALFAWSWLCLAYAVKVCPQGLVASVERSAPASSSSWIGHLPKSAVAPRMAGKPGSKPGLARMNYDNWKLSTPPEYDDGQPECTQCGDTHSPTRCEWADTCAECSRIDVDMAEPRLCFDCAESMERAAKRERWMAARELI